jgi:feruloyl esterase
VNPDQFYPFTWALGAAFNPVTFSFDTDEATLDKTLASLVNANDPDLARFQKHGGKLLMYTGTADPLVPYPDTLHYYERVIHAQHDSLADTQAFFRYYLIPGVGHCGGGPGLNDFGDLLPILQTWVEQNTAPNELPASNAAEHLKRNLCPYPEFPTYIKGDPTLASSFTCRARTRDIVNAAAARYLK